MSIICSIQGFNLWCYLFGHANKVLKPLYSLRLFKETSKSIRVGSICKCTLCGKESTSYVKSK